MVFDKALAFDETLKIKELSVKQKALSMGEFGMY
jgi:hypothetical protein